MSNTVKLYLVAIIDNSEVQLDKKYLSANN